MAEAIKAAAPGNVKKELFTERFDQRILRVNLAGFYMFWVGLVVVFPWFSSLV